jgi:hypothetical protein
MVKKQVNNEIDVDSRICIKCNKVKGKNKFYASSKNKLIDNSKFCLCKDCIKEAIDYKNIKSIYNILQLLGLPFISSKWEEVLNNYKGTNKDVLGNYIRQVATLHQWSDLDWNDSEFKSDKVEEVEEDAEEEIEDEDINDFEDDDFGLTKDIIEFWGKGLPIEQYQALQNFYDEFSSEYETDSPAQRLNFKNAAKTQYQADIALAKGEVNLYNQLMKTLSTILGDSNVKPVQATGAEANDQMSYGLLIKKFESEKPVEEKLDSEMKKYIDTFMVGHLAKMEGLNNEMVKQYEEAISDYTINLSDVKSEEIED